MEKKQKSTAILGFFHFAVMAGFSLAVSVVATGVLFLNGKLTFDFMARLSEYSILMILFSLAVSFTGALFSASFLNERYVIENPRHVVVRATIWNAAFVGIGVLLNLFDFFFGEAKPPIDAYYFITTFLSVIAFHLFSNWAFLRRFY